MGRGVIRPVSMVSDRVAPADSRLEPAKLELRSKPVDLPDPLAELLIFGLLAETGQHQTNRVRAIIGDTRHDQRVDCFQSGRSEVGGHMRCFPQFPCL